MSTEKFPFLTLTDKTGSAPLYQQIYESIRRAILSGEFTRGGRLPATRLLATQLGVARMTVVNAYEQLLIEGYLEGKTGAGTYVAATLPEEMLQIARDGLARRKTSPVSQSHILSRRGKWLAAKTLTELRVQGNGNTIAFQIV